MCIRDRTEDELLKVLENQKKGDPKKPQKQPELEKIGKAWDTAFNFTSMPDDKDLLVSSGPFKIENIVENNSVTVKKNENYTGDMPGKLDEITVRTISDPVSYTHLDVYKRQCLIRSRSLSSLRSRWLSVNIRTEPTSAMMSAPAMAESSMATPRGREKLLSLIHI